LPPKNLSVVCAAGCLVVALVTGVITLPALDGPLVLDSNKLRALENVAAEHGGGAWLHPPAFGGTGGRVLAMASFVLNVQLDGGLSPFALKLTNIFIHVVAGGLVFVLARLLLGAAGSRAPDVPAALLALATAALWTLSPVNLNVALYAVQRMAQLSALFTLAGLILYTLGRLRADAPGRGLYLAGALVCLPLAVLSKQNGILLLPLAFLVEVYFLHPARPWLRGRSLVIIGVAGATAALALLFYLHPGVLEYRHRDFTAGERLLSQPRALLSYLLHLLAPHGADTGIYTDGFQPSRSVLEPPLTLPALGGVVAIALFAVLGARGRLRPAAFGAAFFLVGHALESSVIGLELYFLHRNYLPAFGVYFALVSAAALVLTERRWLVTAVVLAAAWFAVIGHARALTWSSRDAIAAAAVAHNPASTRALSVYAQRALERGDPAEAAAALERVLRLEDTANARVQRLYIRCRTGEPIPAAAYRTLADVASPGRSIELAQSLDNLLRLYRGGGCPGLDIHRLVAGLDRLADRLEAAGRGTWSVDYYADTFLHASGERERALARLAGRMAGGHLPSGLYRVELLLSSGNHAGARRALAALIERFDAARLDRHRQTIEAFRGQLAKPE